ncbi:type II toxin-antitoxin system ParD family antitoxin [Bosea sp. 685]|uniref:type II toxin-antitoxin system ParD family antitoxin n=1 Tax=Bosea sp. 685 TaxID=3080057 RepID=UPI00289323CB|nr:type II toxin-antitoxin system ParD family antitoxin [Bosea sp. 685]WNJ89558.1 type II toxin-antitoxin system ParD family antitoxin [Bosea sp. 685]
MDVPIGERWQSFVAAAVETGRYVSASDVVTEGLRLVQEREERLQALREMVEESIARGGSHTGEEVAAAIEAALDEIDIAAPSR